MRSSDYAICPCCESLFFIPELVRVSDLASPNGVMMTYRGYMKVMSGNTKGPVTAEPFDAENAKTPKR